MKVNCSLNHNTIRRLKKVAVKRCCALSGVNPETLEKWQNEHYTKMKDGQMTWILEIGSAMGRGKQYMKIMEINKLFHLEFLYDPLQNIGLETTAKRQCIFGAIGLRQILKTVRCSCFVVLHILQSAVYELLNRIINDQQHLGYG